MRKLLYLFIILTGVAFSQVTSTQSVTKTLTTADSVLTVNVQTEWVYVAVSDTGAADTVSVQIPITTITEGTAYATLAYITDLSVGTNVTGLYGSADSKVYRISAQYLSVIRFLLSDYASSGVFIRVSGKP